MERKLFVHYLCPFAQRALYVAGYKGLQLSIVEVDLSDKPFWLYELNPAGLVPIVVENIEGKQYSLFESLQVCEYLESLSEPYLYPRYPDGSLDTFKKAIVDSHIKLKVDGFVSSMVYFYLNEPTLDNTGKIRDTLKDLDKNYLEGGNFFSHKILGVNEVGMGDIALFPFMERLMAFKEEPWKLIVEGLEIQSVLTWYSKMSEFPWIQKYLADKQRLLNLLSARKSGQYKGLKLPLSHYDNY